MVILRYSVAVYRQITYVPEGDKLFPGNYASKNCVNPSTQQLQEMFHQ